MKILYEISEQLGLGTVVEPPRRLTGGLLHQMYALSTPRGKYAVKLLNLNIMARPWAMDCFHRSESLETLLEQTDVPILPALRFGGGKMQENGGQFFYVFNWFDGKALRSDEVDEEHCRIIAGHLAQIHGIARREERFEYEADEIDWDSYVRPLSDRNAALGDLLQRNLDMLYETEDRAYAACARVPQVATICHNDMDCKNVLWNGRACRIIDLECLDWSNPFIELYETALYWSGIEQCCVDPHRFEAFIRAYEDTGGELPNRWTVIHDANCGRLGWLEYNLKRSLGMDCSAEEISIGKAEVEKTIAQLAYYHEIRERLN